MGETDYNTLLYEKMKTEQDKYRDWLLTQEPAEILNHTYQFTVQENIVMRMKDFELEPKQAKALLRSPCPLSDVYKEFCRRYDIYEEEIVDSIVTHADQVMKQNSERESR